MSSSQPEAERMKALLLVAHGSKCAAANEEVTALAGTLASRAQTSFEAVLAGFMQFASPSVAEQIGALVSRGATEIVVFPYFIAAGTHVLADIPEHVRLARAQHPQVTFRLISHLGKLPGVVDLILSEVTQDDQ